MLSLSRKIMLEGLAGSPESVPGFAKPSHAEKMAQARKDYYHKSGVAHATGHAAHEYSKRIKSGEIADTPASHETGHALHSSAVQHHTGAHELGQQTDDPAAQRLHEPRIASHEKMMTHHGKKSGRY